MKLLLLQNKKKILFLTIKMQNCILIKINVVGIMSGIKYMTFNIGADSKIGA